MSVARHLGGDYELHEGADRVGGHVVTTSEDGFRFDRTGHLLHLRDPAIRSWIEELLPGRLVEVRRKSVVYSHGRYTRYPYQANTFGLDPDVAYECLMGFLDAQRALPSHDAPAPKSFEDFCLRYFGAGFSRHFMIPYNQKVWGVHPREITAAWCQRFVPIPKLEDVIAGAVGRNDRELGYNASFLYPRSGIWELSDAIHRCLPRPAALSAKLEAVDWRKREVTVGGRRHAYRTLVSTVPLDRLVACLLDAPDSIQKTAARLRCTSLRYLDVAVDEPCQRDLHWVYVPEQRHPFYRVGCYSSFSPEMAPAGCSSFYVELAERAEPDLEALGPLVARSLAEMGLISAPEKVRFVRPRCLTHAYVLYDHAYEEVVPEIHAFLREHGIISTGRYGAWNYSAMEDALLFGRETAELVKREA